MAKAPTNTAPLDDDKLYSVKLVRVVEPIPGVIFRPSDQSIQMKGHMMKLVRQKDEGAIDDYAEAVS